MALADEFQEIVDSLPDDWTDIVREIRSSGMSATMTTGGRGITAEKARAAKLAGMESVSVSIDGNEATHDRGRKTTRPGARLR